MTFLRSWRGAPEGSRCDLGALAGVDGLTVEEWRAPGDDRDLSALCAEIVQFFRSPTASRGERARVGGRGPHRRDRAQVFIRKVRRNISS